MSKEEEIIEAFKDPKRGLTSNVKTLKKRFPGLSDIDAEIIRKTLYENSEIYQRNKKIRKDKIFRSYKAGFVGQLIHMDLMTLNITTSKQKVVIENFKYLLVAVDTYSRMLFCRLLNTKRKNEVKEAVLIGTFQKSLCNFFIFLIHST